MLPSLRRQGKDEVFLWLILCDLFQPFYDMTEVSPRFLHFSGIAKKSRRVVDGSHAVPHPVGPGTVLAGNAKVGRDDLLRFKDPEINRTAVKNAILKDGEVIDGAEVVQTEGLQIR